MGESFKQMEKEANCLPKCQKWRLGPRLQCERKWQTQETLIRLMACFQRRTEIESGESVISHNSRLN